MFRETQETQDRRCSGIDVLSELDLPRSFLCLRHPARRGGLGHPKLAYVAGRVMTTVLLPFSLPVVVMT